MQPVGHPIPEINDKIGYNLHTLLSEGMQFSTSYMHRWIQGHE